MPAVSAPADEHVLGDVARQFRRGTVGLVVTDHPHPVVGSPESHLSSRLYPYLLESKHQVSVALHLLADPAYHRAGARGAGDRGHRRELLRVVVIVGSGGAQLGEAGDRVAVGA